MEFDFTTMSAADRYRLLASAVTPRPIAWITTVDDKGRNNAAPFSFFNLIGSEPPLLAVGMMRRPDGTHKDSAANIIATGEFVVNLVQEADASAMNFTSIDGPPGFDEAAVAGLALLPSTAIAPPRIASAPVAMECRLVHVWEAGRTTLAVGEVARFHIDPRFYDPERRRIDVPSMHIVGRAQGTGWYVRQTDMFELDRPTYADWIARQGPTG